MDVHSCSLYCSLSPFYPERNVQIGDKKDLPMCASCSTVSTLCDFVLSYRVQIGLSE